MPRLLRLAVRRLGWDRNPIRRRVDRIQAILTAILLVLLLVAAPLTASLVAARTYADGLRAEHREQSAYRSVLATVVRVGDVRANGAGHFVGETLGLRWPDRQGRTRSGTLEVDYRAREGAVLRMWTDAAGALSHQPRTHGRTRSDTTWAGIAGGAGVAIPVFVIYVLARRRLDRHRYRQWESEWARIAPLWTRRTN